MPAKKQNLDFTNVKDGGGQFSKTRFPEADYKAKIVAVADVVAKGDKTPMYLYTIEVSHKGRRGTYPLYCKLSEESLWKLRQLFAAAGVVIAKKRVALDPNKIVGRMIGVTLQDEEYNGKLQSGIQYTIPLSEVVGDDSDVDDEDDEEVEDQDTEDETEDEEEDEEPTPPPAKKRAKKQPEPEPEPEEDEEDEEEEDEEDEPAPPKRTSKKSAPVAKKKVAKKSVTDDDLDELDLEDL